MRARRTPAEQRPPNERLFHLSAAEPLLRALAADGQWAPPSLASEGFVHLSFAPQLLGTLATHFANAGELLLAEVVLASETELKLEVSRGGARFPHVYRPLARGEFARHWRLPAAAEAGEIQNRGLPNFGSTPVLDDPSGAPGLPDLAGGPD